MFLHLFLSRYFVFGCLVVIVTVGAGCASGSTPTPTPTPAPTSTPTPQPLSPLGILQQSHERSKDIGSFRAQLDLDITTPEGQVLITTDMETGMDGRVRTVLEIDAFGEKQTIEMVVAGPYVYVDVPDRGWTQMSAAAIAGSTGQSLDSVSDPRAFYSNLFPAQEVPWDLYVVKSLGREQVDGVQTEHLSIKADFQEIWQHLDDDQRQQFLQAIPDPEVAIEEIIEAIQVNGVEVWIDDQGYSRRTIMEIIIGGEALDGEMSMKMDMRMFDINKEVTIKLPGGYEDFENPSALEPTDGISPYEELLALIPDTPATRSSVFLNDHDFLRQSLSLSLPSPNASQEALKNYFELLRSTLFQLGATGWGEAPFISGYNPRVALRTLGLGQHMAFDMRNVNQSAVAGTPRGRLGVMLGDFDPAATDAALENCVASVPDCAPALQDSHEGVAFYSWGGDSEVDINRILAPPAFDHLGRGGRVVVQDRHAFYTVETPGMEALIEASLRQRPSLLDAELFRLLAKAMSELGAHASFLSDQTMSVEGVVTELQGRYASQEQAAEIRAQITATPGLKPYLVFATGEGVDQGGPYMALALVHTNAETAEGNVNLLLRRIDEVSSLMTNQRWAEMVDKAAVRTDGRVLLARLHGRISRAWVAMVFNRDSLLIHGDTTSTDRSGATPVPLPTLTPFPTAAAAVQAAVQTAPAAVAQAQVDDEAASPEVKQDVVTSEVAESDPVSDEGVFVRVIAPLDEARGYCLDIPGHRTGVRIESPLQVHTCKHGIWNQDGRFDAAALGTGVLRMPQYDLCLQAENNSIGAGLLLAECTHADLQTWTLQDSGEIALEAFPQVCITVEEGPGRDAGGPQYLMRGVGLDTCAQHASGRQRWTTVIP